MAKSGRTTTATEPTIAPPPLVVTPDDVPTEPEIDAPASTLPAGVSMHDADKLPNAADRAKRIARDPTQPPIGWKGTFSSCGGCGDFLGNADRCPQCAPPVDPNIVNGGP